MNHISDIIYGIPRPLPLQSSMPCSVVYWEAGSESVYLSSTLAQCSTPHIQGTLYPGAKYLGKRYVKLNYTFLLQLTHNLGSGNYVIRTALYLQPPRSLQMTSQLLQLIKRKKTNLTPLFIAYQFLIRDFPEVYAGGQKHYSSTTCYSYSTVPGIQ